MIADGRQRELLDINPMYPPHQKALSYKDEEAL